MKPFIVAPAMNTLMYNVKEQKTITSDSFDFIFIYSKMKADV